MKKITTFYIVRHGQSQGNANLESHKETEINTAGGTSLTSLGREQAKEIAKKLKNIQFDEIFSSGLNRAKETAEIIALERKLAVLTKDAINERSFSHYAKHFPDKTYEELTAEIRADLEKLEDVSKLSYKHSPAMESADESAERLLIFLCEAAVGYPGKTILVVNHGNIMRSLLTKLGFAKFDELPSGSVRNTGYIVLESDGTDFFIKETHGVTKIQGKFRAF